MRECLARQGFRRKMHARLGWMICGALAVTVINWLMTHLDPVWFHHNVKETHLTRPVSQSWLTSSQTAGKVHSSISPVSENWLTSPQTAGKVHQPGSQKWHTIPRTTEKGVYQDIGVKRLDPIIYSEACSGTINDSRRNTFFNDYVKVQHYLDDLFGSMADINALSKDADPVFISDASSNHFRESMDMFNNFNSVVRKMKPNLRMIFYDLGLQIGETEKIKSVCQCEYRQFPFEKYPQHVKELNGYAFKPLLIMMVLKEYPFAAWIDASIRFTPSNISQLFDMARRLDIICVAGDGSVARRTLPVTFKYFHEQPCTFRNLSEIQSGFLITRTTPFVVKNILKPWIACALTIDCMVPIEGGRKYLYCGNNGNVYGDCHRNDQSAWAILLYRAYGYDVYQRMQTYGGEYFKVSRL